MDSVGLPSTAKDDDFDDAHPVIAWRCGSCNCCTQDLTFRECEFCLMILPVHYCVFGGPVHHLVPAFGRLSISWLMSPIDNDVQQFNLLNAVDAPFQPAQHPTNDEVYIAWECDFCKCTTKDLNRCVLSA